MLSCDRTELWIDLVTDTDTDLGDRRFRSARPRLHEHPSTVYSIAFAEVALIANFEWDFCRSVQKHNGVDGLYGDITCDPETK